MACCIFAAWLFGLLLSGLERLKPGSTPRAGSTLPPSAVRSAPAPPIAQPAPSVPAVPALAVAASDPGPGVRSPAVAAAWSLRFFALGIELYVLAVVVLSALGAATALADPLVGWIARDIAFAGTAIAAMAIAGAITPLRPLPPRGDLGAPALVGLGVAWLAMGIVDQHVFALFEIAGGSLAWDAVFHGAGSLAVSAGLALAARSQLTLFSLRRLPA